MSDSVSIDALSQLFERLNLKAEGLARMLILRAPWGIAVPVKPREFTLYSVRSGSCVLARKGHDPVTLNTGDAALMLRDVPHCVHDGSGTNLKPLSYWLEQQTAGCSAATPHSPESEDATWLISERFTLWGTLGCPVAAALGDCIVLRADEESSVGQWQQSLFQMLCIEASNPRPGNRYVYARLMELFFVEFVRACAGKHWATGKGTILRVLFDPQILKAVEAVHEDPARPWTVELLAKAAGMSRTAFAVRFAELADTTPLSYVTQWRMALAEELLAEGYTPGEVAGRIGYESDAAFSRAFKRLTGKPPGAMRKKNAKILAESMR
jgi:AraC-like DNA-binding protein